MTSRSRKRRRTLENLVKNGKNDELKSIITQSDPSDLVETFGNTVLHFAAKYNNTDIITFLLNSNYHINARNSSGSTPLFTASKHRNFDAVKILLNADADIFATNAADQTILGILIEQNMSFDVFECFLQAVKRSGADVDTVADLFLNANCDMVMVVSLHDARVTKTILQRMTMIESAHAQSAIQFAMKSNDVENVFVLLHFGPEKDLRMALFFDNLVNLAKGPHMNLQSFETFVSVIDRWTIVDKDRLLECFHELFISADEDAVRVLLNYEVDVKLKKKFGVDLIAGVFSNENVDVVELLKTRKFDVNAQGFRKLSALHFALRSTSEINLQFLIDLGADINIKDRAGRTPVIDNHAWNVNCLGRILLQHGADVQVFDNAGLSIWNRTNVEKAIDFIIPQMSILEARGVAIDLRHRVFLNDKKFVDVYGMCCYQCEILREYKLTELVTLLDVLTERTERIAVELGDEDFKEEVGRYCLENRVINYYSDCLKMKLERAMIVYRSKRNLARIVSGFTGCDVSDDHLVVEKIFGLLRYRDMCSLV